MDQGEFNLQKVIGSLDQAKGLKVTCLLCYCSEGDNIPDAFNLAGAACKLLELSLQYSHGELELFPICPAPFSKLKGGA